MPASLARHHIEGITFATLTDRPKLLAPLNLTYRRGANSAALQRFIDAIHTAARTS